MRKIQYLAISGNEIFILEGACSIVRLALVPDSDIRLANGMRHATPQNEYQILIEEEVVMDGDECFELPPIECIELNVPLACSLNEHNLLKEDKLLLEHSRKCEVFEKINTLDYDDSILFDTGTKKKKKIFPLDISALTSTARPKVDGIVEIGHQAESIDKIYENPVKINEKDSKEPKNVVSPSPSVSKQNESNSCNHGLANGPTIKPCLMEVSYCDDINTITSRLSPNKLSNELNPLDEQVELNINPISVDMSSENPGTKFKPLEFNYPLLGYPIVDVKEKINTNTSFNSDENDFLSDNDGDNIVNSGCNKQKNGDSSNLSSDVPKIAKLPNFAEIPKLWDIKIEKYYDMQCPNDSGTNQNSSGSLSNEGSENEWVFL